MSRLLLVVGPVVVVYTVIVPTLISCNMIPNSFCRGNSIDRCTDELTLTGCGYIGEMPQVVCQLKIHNSAMVLEVDCLERISCDLVCCEVCS